MATYLEIIEEAKRTFNNTVKLAKEDFNKEDNTWLTTQVYNEAIKKAIKIYDETLKTARIQFLV